MKSVFITGANRSIGFETAKRLWNDGYFVYIGSRDQGKGEAAAAQIGSERIAVVQLDVTDPSSIQAAHNQVSSTTGSLDVLINNAGILGGYAQQAINAPGSTIREVFDTNFFGVISLTQALMNLLQKSAQPRIVNVTSGLASLTNHSDPSWKYYNVKGAAYGPSKTALNAYTVVLAYELRDTAFKVNAIDPGYTATDFNQHRGTGTVEDAAAIIVRFATLDENGPTGKFYSNDAAGGEMAW
ncbi:NAD(P)-dependent dehydrogenase (short-subunit alcohol dehydrogenase family) [Chitinophaga polysaccharea]|uniref:NAD(P)-dependent dehydrogenase (Short-subunit alcohol dehydrogenase family) n=1 Tax=Chitinophaga polysaccharea TaxID=1293035 RepID=A0A561PUI1_9BACT|nr:SDR family NAD(P)-dependent oxidoreductase [Chitinophaga polysaccharea]TWF41728.1 NAD(P)-dependent dehydrogenase (short-subunit alcohol dehydrogenase family) [Chitinophaga polysaccharea]